MGIVERLKQMLSEKKHTAPQAAPAASEPPKAPGWSVPYTYGMHLYRRADEDSTVYYLDESRGIRRMVVDRFGKILNFPGFEQGDWMELVEQRYLQPQIRFRTDFGKKDDHFVMLWQIQPDSRYWGDEDGFGMEGGPEVTLYAFVDENGEFTAPFRPYQIGVEYYYGK